MLRLHVEGGEIEVEGDMLRQPVKAIVVVRRARSEACVQLEACDHSISDGSRLDDL